MSSNKELNDAEKSAFLELLATRFSKNMKRHEGLAWADVLKRLEAQPEKLWTIHEMEKSGGEPDVVSIYGDKGEIIFVDCAAESPAGRRSLCYDREALDSRKEFKPESSALDMAAAMGISILSEAEYRALQEFGKFDLKTSSWIHTPPDIRKLGGALFCDPRYNQVFTYHNGAQSYYAARGFRGKISL